MYDLKMVQFYKIDINIDNNIKYSKSDLINTRNWL